MPKKGQIWLRLALSILLLSFSIGLYSRLPGTENIRGIHIMTLVAIGMMIGIFLVNFFMLVRGQYQQKQKTQE